LFALFAGGLVLFGGWTGVRSLFSFMISGLMIWKVLVPLFLNGVNPVPLAFGVVTLLSGLIIFLVAGFNAKGATAFGGAILGVATSCLLSLVFTRSFHLHGAIMPFAETLLYSGYGHLDMTGIYVAGVFICASGAVMDLAMDVAASMDEVRRKSPGIGKKELFLSGLRVSRAVVGTMTTTLLFAYSGGYITLLMAFMAQGIPVANMLNLIYVAAEVSKTLIGSMGLILVGPFTALVGSWLLERAGGMEPKKTSPAFIFWSQRD
ncbi:MAG: YibE/F family protein, partial [Desulfobacterales bacterium]|nr:YibE/F family protein [Desulfobacterales bacterium]